MTTRTRGLGRGLGALIAPTTTRPAPDAAAITLPPPASGSPEVPAVIDLDHPGAGQGVEGTVVGQLRMIAVTRIAPNGRQPRQDFDEEALEQLSASIREVGLLQPIVVRSLGAGDYELIMGERRWRAAQLAELVEIPAIVRETADDAMLRDALLENLHREQLHALEEAAAYTQLLNDFGCTHDELANRVGRSRSHITNTIRLLSLPPTVQRRVAAGVLTAGHARALLSFPTASQQEQVATRIVAEGLSVRAVEELAALAEPEKPTRRRPSRTAPPGLEDVAGRLSERFETRVKVEMGRSKGRITVEFASFDDLERIVTAMAPAPPSWA
ncbi:MAG TPA: ParB/RepB/Spo0J family partition protein [Frankiaceae bacterium]|jgi:ParB family chromosome partitioning protein|nr:ParB/RepB/Spo0J family partition protein [Frankiaceae bacterium]